MSGAWGKGSTRRWRGIRARVLKRDGGRCQLHLNGCTTIATEVHHLDGKALGDSEDRLVASCMHCNRTTGDPNRSNRDPEHVPRTAW